MKKSTFTKLTGMALAMAVGVSCMASCGGNAEEEVFYIGASGPLTGPAAVYGLGVQNSAELAVEEINANGGFYGTKFKFVIMDDEAETTKVATNYATMYEAGMQVSLGCVTSGSCLEYKTYAKQDNVFCLTPSATSDSVPADAPNMYQMCFSDSGQGSASATYIMENYSTAKVGVFYNSSDPYSSGIVTNFDATYTGTTVKASFTNDTATDFSTQITLLKDCDFLFMPIYYTPASLFIKQAKDMGTFADNVVYFGCDGFDGIDTVEGFDVYSISQEISYLSHFNANADDEATKNFVKNYTDKYGASTLNQFGAGAYDSVYAIYNAMKAAKEAGTEIPTNISASDLCEILKAQFQGGFKFSGVTGKNITWDANGLVNKFPTKYIVNEKPDHD